MFLELWDHDPSKIKHNIFLCVILCRLGFPRDVLGQSGTGHPIVPLYRDKKVSLSRCSFVRDKKSFFVSLSLCHETRAAGKILQQTLLSQDQKKCQKSQKSQKCQKMPNNVKKCQKNYFYSFFPSVPWLSWDISGRDRLSRFRPGPSHSKISKSRPGPFCVQILCLSCYSRTMNGLLSRCPLVQGQWRDFCPFVQGDKKIPSRWKPLCRPHIQIDPAFVWSKIRIDQNIF